MAATNIIKIICPNLFTDSNLNDFVALAQLNISSCYYGLNYDQAVALYASHVYTLSKRSNGASGSINSLKEGDLSIGYGSQSATSEDLPQTNYGLQLLALMKRKQPAVTVTGSNYAGLSNDLYCEDS